VGLVSAQSASSLTVVQANGASATLAIDGNTTFFEGKSSLTVAALATGEHVNVAPSLTASATAARIDILLIKLGGTVSAVNSSAITVTGAAGFTGTVDVSGTTVYTQAGKSATLGNVLVGMRIVATGTVSADQSALVASSVAIGSPTTFTGIVTAASAASLTVQQSSTVSATLAIIPTTKFYEGSKHVAAAALAVGESVNVKLSTGAPSTAARIDIVVVKLGGVVSAVNGYVITVTGAPGFTRTIDASATTTYSEAGKPATLNDVKVGFHVSATGTVSADQSALDATSVVISAR
jgi:hypothetical protein